MKKLLILAAVLIAVAGTLFACREKADAGSKTEIAVTLFSGGQIVKSWPTREVTRTNNGYLFYVDGRPIMVSGTVAVEQL